MEDLEPNDVELFKGSRSLPAGMTRYEAMFKWQVLDADPYLLNFSSNSKCNSSTNENRMLATLAAVASECEQADRVDL